MWKMSGSGAKGIKPGILLATVIGYAVLVFLAYKVVAYTALL
jgi:hypothetical protein